MGEYDKNARKKKIFTAPRDKEFTTRKPVILTKNDREYKDFDRNKQQRDKPAPAEKEKQPVIMIKTREPSATKDENRPQSPKRTGKENDIENAPVIQSVKIAQNENKEKKISESKSVKPPTAMTQPVKLIDEFLDFSPNVAEYLTDTNSNFLVVGVIGNQSVGKSTIMNILAHNSDLSNICNEILKSQDASSSSGEDDTISQTILEKILPPVDSNDKIITNSNFVDEITNKPLIFKSQNMEQIETVEACTSGIDLYVTNSRIILLDTGPICGMGNARLMGYNPVCRGGLEIPAFLLAVCHIVILVQDWFTDLNILRFVQSAEMVKPSIPAASNINQNSVHSSSASSASNQDNDNNLPKEHYPHLLFLQNKCSMDDFKPESIKLMQDLFRKAFSESKMNIYSGMYMYDSDSTNNSNQIDSMFHNLNAERCGKPVNLFLMPAITEDHNNKFIYRGHPSIEELAHRLRWQIFGASRNQLTNVQLNERTWLQYCNKTWDNIKKSTFFMEYNRLCEFNSNK